MASVGIPRLARFPRLLRHGRARRALRLVKHPLGMSPLELMALPVVDHLEQHEITFVAADHRIWDVGRNNGVWVKRLAPTSPPAEENHPTP